MKDRLPSINFQVLLLFVPRVPGFFFRPFVRVGEKWMFLEHVVSIIEKDVFILKLAARP